MVRSCGVVAGGGHINAPPPTVGGGGARLCLCKESIFNMLNIDYGLWL